MFDVITHPDLVKIWGSARPQPSKDPRFYYEPAIEAMLDAGVAMEVSTAGLRKPVGEIYPARAMLEMAVDAGIPIALSSRRAPARAPRVRLRGGGQAARGLRREGDRGVREAARGGWSRSGDTDRARDRLAPLRRRAPADPRRRRDPARARASTATPTPTCSPTRSPTRSSARRRWATSARTSRTPTSSGAGADSIELLREIVRRVAAEGWRVEHVDATVMLERPKLAPHREAIMARLAEAVGALGAREGDDRRADGLRRPRGGRRRDGRRHVGAPRGRSDASWTGRRRRSRGSRRTRRR